MQRLFVGMWLAGMMVAGMAAGVRVVAVAAMRVYSFGSDVPAGGDDGADRDGNTLPETVCPECGGAIEQDDIECPHCGANLVAG